jgi:hypothetical protein
MPPRIKQRVNAWVDVPAGGGVRVGGELIFSFISRIGWALNANSKLWCNGMELLRSRLPDGGDSLGLSLDGATNWIGPADDNWRALGSTQADDVAYALCSVWTKVRSGLSLARRVADPTVALRDVELCHDLDHSSAIATVVALHGSYPEGSRHVVETFYPEVQSNTLSSHGAGVRWAMDGSGELALKAYAKCRRLLRLEVAASKGRGVSKLIEAVPQHTNRDVVLLQQPLSSLLRRVMAGGAVHVDALLGHVVETRNDDSLWADLLEGLAPLLALRGTPTRNRPGAPVTAATLALARDTLTDLLLLGCARPLTSAGKLVPRGNPVRDALDAMTRPHGPLVFRRGYRRNFVLRPKFAGARHRLSQALLTELRCAPTVALAAE